MCFSFRRFIAEIETAISGSFTDARLPNANDTEQQMDQWIAGQWKDFKYVGTAHIICNLDRPAVSTLPLIFFHKR